MSVLPVFKKGWKFDDLLFHCFMFGQSYRNYRMTHVLYRNVCVIICILYDPYVFYRNDTLLYIFLCCIYTPHPYYPLLRVRSWNNGMRCMSLYILMAINFLSLSLSLSKYDPLGPWFKYTWEYLWYACKSSFMVTQCTFFMKWAKTLIWTYFGLFRDKKWPENMAPGNHYLHAP